MKRSATVALAAALVTGCGTSLTVRQPLSPPAASGVRFVVVSCEAEDRRAPPDTCRKLQDRVRYGLVARDMLQREPGGAAREVRLRITYYRDLGSTTRFWLGPLVGKDGIDVAVSVSEAGAGEQIASAVVSNFNYSAANFPLRTMLGETASKVVAFLDGSRVR